MPLVVNQSFDAEAVASFFDNTQLQDSTIKAMVDEAVRQNFWGWQVDFEQVNIAYRDKFTVFLKNLDQALNEKGLISSVAVIAQTSTDPGDYKKDYWNKFIGVYDYSSLASSTDFISIMSYDDPGSKGPVARYEWLKSVLDFALKSIPPEKISLGIPFYYWRWNDTLGKHVATGGYTQMQDKMSDYDMTYGYSTKEEAAYLEYTNKKTHYTIWFENGRSVKAKIDLIKKYGLHGFSAWALGLEVPSVFDSLGTNIYQASSSINSSTF